MNTAKTLMLAGIAAASLGVGTAMAQEGGPSMIGPNDYWTLHERALYAHATPTAAAQIQSGSSDVSQGSSGLGSGWVGDNSPYRFSYGTMADPG